jgi:hypothetical protein
VTVRVKVTVRRGAGQAVARSEGVWRDLQRRANNVIIQARRTAPVDTGQYAFGVGGPGGFRRDRIRARGGAAVRITALAPHALIVEKGSGPHIIEPSGKQALWWPGAAHPVGRVHHPGTPARHTLRNALLWAASL